MTGTLVAGLNLWTAYHVWKRRRHASAIMALLIASVMEVYGTIMYFGSAYLDHWADVDTSSFVHAWLMFFGLNALWLIFPGWCIYEIVLGAAMIAPVGAKVSILRTSAECTIGRE